MTASLDRRALAALVDHTLLRPEATAEDVVALCEEAVDLGTYAVCVAPTRVTLAVSHLSRLAGGPPGLPVASVVGFPSGNHLPEIKAGEAARAVDDGAAEVDMVIDLGKAAEGHWSAVESEVAAVRRAAPAPVVLKVIVESALLTVDGLVAACRVAEAGGADFVKTSTGFSPAGGASVAAARQIAAEVGGRLGVKASGGIRTAEQALALVDAGATRLGLSATAAVLAGLPEPAAGLPEPAAGLPEPAAPPP